MIIAIVFIIKKVQPSYSLILGALIGGIIGSGDLVLTVNTMVGDQDLGLCWTYKYTCGCYNIFSILKQII